MSTTKPAPGVTGSNGSNPPPSGPSSPQTISAEYQSKVDTLIARYDKKMREEWTPAVLKRQEEVRSALPGPQAADPIANNGYQLWNCFTVGPFSLVGDEFQPAKVIEHDALSLMLGVIWINPTPGLAGFSGSQFMAFRNYVARFETMNVSTVSNGPDFQQVDQFTDPATNLLTFVPFVLPTADPGPRPQLFETTLTVDIIEDGLPMAAFSTWHFDIDNEPPFLGVPGSGPEWQQDIPARYMVYRR